MITVVRTDSASQDFIDLVKPLDAYLAFLDGEEHAFYNKLNTIDALKHAVVAYDDNKPVGCGAMKELTLTSMEVKRMFTLPEWRGKKIASQILTELELWAKELGYKTCNLETGKRQPEAIALYEKSGYQRIANYGKYIGIDNSVCFEKAL